MPHAPSHDEVIAAATQGLAAYCDLKGIDASHGVDHAEQVLRHAEMAIASAEPPLSAPVCLTVRLAALLHDADDKKYSPETAKIYANARSIMEAAGATAHGERVIDEAISMISLVSCSANGNYAPPESALRPELLWPRWADRLEATGTVGVVRCWMYNQHVGAPMAVETTPRAKSEAELWSLATPERFETYQRSGGGSTSMMDHFYDKLLQIARPPPEIVANRYLEAAAAERVAPLVSVCLEFGETGVVPDASIRDMARELGMLQL
mmetsp:Transcript_40814/g.87057  ORF Transcript_40814/g.87057 Transcript_40814/m.87057 type:complete len:266 (-) Transcript_40814:166-963(-)